MEDTKAKTSMSDRAHRTFAQVGIKEDQIPTVERIKTTASVLWDQIDSIGTPPDNTENGRMISIAKTKLEETVMWATKAVSRKST